MRATTPPDPPGREDPSGRDYSTSARLTRRLCDVIPGGAHTYAKGADQYPEGMAPVIRRGLGARVWDVDGFGYLEYGSGLRSVALGHAHPRVTAAVTEAVRHGSNFTRPAEIELTAAEALLALLPRADMVKFAKNGSDATTAAVKLARAVTGRDLVATCRDHPFFSVDDWFIGTTPMSAGVPSAVRAMTAGFRYGDLDDVRRLFTEHPEQIACLITEPATTVAPPPGYYAGLRRLCDEHGVLLVLDEMITGFRWATGGAQDLFDIDPDLSTFGKAMGNGFAVAALAGRREHLELGGMDHGRERVFLLSTTHGAETHALAAHLAVIEAHREENVVATLARRGELLAERVRAAAVAADVADHVLVLGAPCNLVHATLDAEGRRSQEFRTLFLAELLRRGVIAPSFVVSAALTPDDVEETASAVYEACLVYRKALDSGIGTCLTGRPVRPALRARD
ncbi:MAG: glutamate-semialdehyde -aminomutase [Actinomycetota bacterium]|nr:glutamate-semialdehyde -aminomutase [Actinomycetota bacterium]